MQDPYQQEPTYQEPLYEEPYDGYDQEPKQGMSGWLIALIVVLVLVFVCCLCVCASSALLGPAIGNTFSVIIEDLPTPIP